MGYEINLGNGEWATGQGGMALTVTDTDTGVKEALLMGCERNSKKTAINKYGKLYEVLPYEPSVTYVDGVGVLNNEPQATYLSRYSNTLTSWNNQGNSIVENGVYENGLKIFDVSMSGANTAINNNTTASLNDVVSWITLVKGVAGETIQVGVYPSNGITHTFNGEWETVEVEGYTLTSNISQFQFNTFSLATARNFSVVSVQVTNTITNQSYLDTQDVTITRLADTGFKTPNISKWSDKDNLSITIDSRVFEDNATSKRISYYINSSDRIIFDFISGVIRVNLFAKGVNIETRDVPCILTDFNSIKVDLFLGTNLTYTLNSDTPVTGNVFTGFTDSLEFLSLTTSGGVGDTYYGQIKGIKITS